MKKYVRSVVAIALTCAMILPLAACSKGKKKGKQKKVAEDDPYFTAEEVAIDLEVDKSKKVSYKDVYEPHLVGDKLICSYDIEYEMPQDLEDQIMDMYMNMKEGEEDQIYSQIEELYSQYSERGMIIFDLEGNILKKTQSDMSSSMNGLTPLPDGGFVTIGTDYDMGECKETYTMKYLDDDGNVTKELPLDSKIEGMWGGTVYLLDNGNFLVSSYSGIYIIDKNGKLLGQDSNEDMQGIVYKVDGKYYAFCYSYDETAQKENCTLNEIDINTGKISKDGKEVSSMVWSAVATENGFYYCGTNGITKLDIFNKKAEPEMILDWNWTDLNRSSIQPESLNIISDDEIMFLKVTYEESDDPSVKYSGTSLSLVKLKREKKNPHAGKTLIQMGAAGVYSTKFMDYIVSYNTDPDNKSRITYKDYSEDLYSADDYVQASKDMADKVYLEMLAGEGPDILLNFSSYSQFNNEDVLVDLNTFIDGDKGFNRDDYFDNVFRAFEVKGKMYQIPVCVDIHGFVANRDLVGDRTSWTYDEFMSVADSLPEDVSLMEEISCSDLLGNLISVSSDTYIDYEKKVVNFDCDDFRKALEIARKYGTLHPSEENGFVGGFVDEFGEYQYVDPMEKVENGMQAMTSAYMYSLRQYADYVSVLKDKAVFLGAPSPKSSGLSAQPMMTLAIAKSCANQEEAWDLIRFMYEKEQQISYAYDFYSVPLLREALDEKTAKDIKDFEEEKAEMQEWGDTEYLEMYYNFDMNEEMAADFIKIIEGVSTITSTDSGIMMIVNEEAPGYFEGQRSAEDVCKNIQNRATTLLNER